MRHTHGADRDAGDDRRGPISTHAQAAFWVNFVDTLMRHFLPRTVGGLARSVIAAPGEGCLVAARRRPPRCSAAHVAAGGAAVVLAAVAAPADVEHRRAVSAAGLAEGVVEALSGA